MIIRLVSFLDKNRENFFGRLFIIISVICFLSCSDLAKDNTIKTEFSLVSVSDSLHYVKIKTDSSIDKWELPYPVYQFKIGDVDNNGSDDIMVGVIKTTRFDSIKGKRLFIFKNYKGLVRPLWLGSRLSMPLVDFSFKKNENGGVIRSIEQEKSGKYLVAEYKYRKFGLKFTTYILREVELEQAFEQLKTNKN